MKRHVRDFVRRCLTCQQVKAENQRPTGLLQPLEVAEWKWEHITMDLVTHFPRMSQKHDTVSVIVDRLTKSAHFLAVRMTFTLKEFYRIYIYERLSGYMECQSLLYRTRIPCLRLTFGKVSKEPWEHN